MKIWLDDIRPIPASFTHWAKTAKEAIVYLMTGECEAISLDHDLGEDSAGTGYNVALWIEQAAHSGAINPLLWTIHSANPIGRARMLAALNNANRYWVERFSG